MEPLLGETESRSRRRRERYRKAIKAGTYLGTAAVLSCSGMPFFEPVAGLLGNFASSALMDNPRTRLAARQILFNHDLALLVGRSIALVLLSVAEQVSPESLSKELPDDTPVPASYIEVFRRSVGKLKEALRIRSAETREERQKLELLAMHAPQFWLERQDALRTEAQRFSEIEEKHLVQYFLSQFPLRTEPLAEPAIPKEDWAELLTQLEQFTLEQSNKQKRKRLTLEQIQPVPELREKVIETLTTLFPTALREMLKYDFSEGSGKAYVSLQLYMQIFLISLLQEVHADTAAIKQQIAVLERTLADKIVETLNAEKDALPQQTLTEILETLKQIQPAILERLKWIQEKLEAMHADVQATHENAQRILADTAEIKQVLKQEYDKEAFFAELRRQARGDFNLIDVQLSLEQHYQELPLLRELAPYALPEEREGRQRDNPLEPSMPYHTVRRWEESVVGQVRIERSYSLEQLFREFHQITRQSANTPPRFIVLGPPGSGKSTLLEYLEYLVGIGDPRIPAQVGIPLRIELKRWEREAPNAPLEEYLLKRYAALPNAPKKPAQWREILEAGESLVAFDGVDEVGNWEEFAPYLREALAATRHCPTILAGRTLSRARFTELGAELPIFYIGELNEAQRNALILAYFTAKGKPQRAEQLIEQLDALPQMSALALNPLLLGLICFTVADERRVQLPATRSEVYERALEKMLAQERGVAVNYPDGVKISLSDKLELASYAATNLFLQMACAHSLLMEDETLLRALRTAAQQAGFSKPRELANALKHDLAHNTRLLSGDEAEGYNFLHLTLLEYLAARGLALRLESGDEGAWEILQSHCDYPRWREVYVFLAGCLAQRNQRQTLQRWIEWLSDESRDDLLRHRLTLAMQSLAEIPVSKRIPYTRLIDSVSEQCFAFWEELYANGVVEKVPHMSDILQAIMRVRGRVEGQPFDEYLANKLRSDDPEQIGFAFEILRHLGVYGAQPAVLDAMVQRLPEVLQNEVAHKEPYELISMGEGRDKLVEVIAPLGARAPFLIQIFADYLPELLRSSSMFTNMGIVDKTSKLLARAKPEVLQILARHLPILIQNSGEKFIYEMIVRAIETLGAQNQKLIAQALTPHLPALLQDEDKRTRVGALEAIEMVGAQATPEMVQILSRYLLQLLQDDTTQWATVRAIRKLGTQATPEIVHTFIHSLPELPQDEATRLKFMAAIGALGAQATPKIIQNFTHYLPAMLQQEDQFTRWAAVQAIGAFGAQATPELVQTFAHYLPELLKHSSTWRAAVRTIGALGAQATPEIIQAFAQRLLVQLWPYDEDERELVLETVQSLDTQRQVMIAQSLAARLPGLLQEPLVIVDEPQLMSSLFYDFVSAMSQLIRTLRAEAQLVIAEAIPFHLPELLYYIETRDAAEMIVRAFRRQVRQKIAEMITSLLPDMLRISDWFTRNTVVWAIEALGAQATPEIIQTFAHYLPELLQDDDKYMRKAAVKAIRALGVYATPEIIQNFDHHLPQLLQEEETREIAIRAIRALKTQATPEIVQTFANYLPELLQIIQNSPPYPIITGNTLAQAVAETVEALGGQGQRQIAQVLTPYLPALLEEADWFAGRVAVRAIEALGPEATPEIIRKFASHWATVIYYKILSVYFSGSVGSDGRFFGSDGRLLAIGALAYDHRFLNALREVVSRLEARERWEVLHHLNTEHNIRFYPIPSGLEWKRVDECGEG